MSKKVSKPAKVAESTAEKTTVIVNAASRERQNGITRPGANSLCGKVWAALDQLRTDGSDTTFTTAREALKDEKMADATVRTQTQRWREFHGINREEKKSARKSGKPAVAKQAAPAVISEEAQQTA